LKQKKKSYQTPPGTDETLAPLPPDLAEYEGKISAHKYRNGIVLKGGRYSTGILDEISNKLNRNKSVVIAVSGPPGVGKTWLAIAFAQFFDPNFTINDSPAPDPNTDTGQVCFDREHISFLVGENTPLKRGQAIVLDESHFGMGARGFQNKDQISLVNLIAAIRSKGFMLIIVTLHSSMLDKIPREHVINYEFAVQDEGIAKTYSRFFPTFAQKAFNKGKGTLKICMPDPYDPDTGLGCDDPNCLECKYMKATDGDRCFNIRAIYERRKDEFLNKMSASDEGPEKKPKRTREERQQLVIDNARFLFRYPTGGITLSSIQDVLALHRQPHGDNVARSIKNAIQDNYKELVASLTIVPEKTI